MKKQIVLLIALLGCCGAMASVSRTRLGGAWEFRQSSSEQWLPATVPGQVHTDLMANGVIEDPFYGTNEKNLQWVGEKDWEYRRTFAVDAAMLSHENVWLVMEGLDTYADVYINGYPVLSTDNMFRTWKVDAKPFLKEGENVIRVYFHSVFRVDMPKYLDSPFRLQAWPNNDQNEVIWLSLYARKAGYNYGWDWGPRLITSGIWRDIYLESWDGLRLDGAQIITKSIAGKNAKMSANVSVVSDKGGEAKVKISCGGTKVAEKSITLVPGENSVTLDFEMKNVQLWWSNGLGGQHLYDFEVDASCGGMSDSETVRTGIRTVEIVRDIDERGQSMSVRLNGRNVFMKGANWIPLDNFPNRVTDEKYEYMIKSAADVNMNMLRIWGGGIYEDPAFYEMCDKYGILVWQDMMFACGMFPADRHYLDNVAAEVRDNVKRLRNHPCIALWNGNNENEISYFGWGWRDKYSPEDDRVYQANLKTLFYDIIPGAILSQDATRYYHPTSPNTGYNGIPHSMGDVHFWSVWKGGWIEEYTYQQNIGRFMSEYGFQSYPDIFTIRKFAPESAMSVGSEVMLAHQRAKNDNTRDPYFGDKMMTMYMEKYFTVPEDFEQFLYMSQLLQAEAVKVGIEAHRRAKPYCMGTLYWQINDCWPAASWSSVDYYGRWKALHYFARHAYSEVLVSPYEEDGAVKVKVVSDRQSGFRAVLEIEAMTLDGRSLYKKEVPFSMAANASSDVYAVPQGELLAGAAAEESFVTLRVTENGAELSSNIYYPVYSNRYDYPDANVNIDVSEEDGGLLLAISANRLVRGLYMRADEESFFDENYITLVPGREYRVKVATRLGAEDFRRQLECVSLKDIGKTIK